MGREEDATLAAVLAIFLLAIIGITIRLALIGVVIWAIIQGVNHFFG